MMKLTVRHFVPQVTLPKEIKNFHLQIQNKSKLPTQKVTSDVIASVRKNLPQLQNVEEDEAQLLITLYVEPAKKNVIQKTRTKLKFRNGFASMPIEEKFTYDAFVETYPVRFTFEDREINYIFYQKQLSIPQSNISQLRHFLDPKKHTSQMKWMLNDLDAQAKQATKKSEFKKAISILSELINDVQRIIDKKKQISLQRMHVLGTLYHNRSIILKVLKQNDAVARDKQKAKTIFSFIGNYYDRK
ncbi:hypothetical protein [Candidatus Uabimicrobium amorphum]|uniref:hypothetical protein n=1 Tax=Uabimicrobium amorphum TaxID=2596890 RepID=UPI00125F903B|nr:hypothetical protein [Candidatus Uabimicrobium amorphum]